MSASRTWARERAQLFAGGDARRGRVRRGAGRKGFGLSRDRRLPPTAAASLLLAALALVGLRVEILEVRYALGAAVARETRLREAQRALTVTVRQLRDPLHLAEVARERGFVRPERVILLHSDGTRVGTGDRP